MRSYIEILKELQEADAVTNCTDNCDACLREEYKVDTNDIVAYLKHLCEDFKNQGEHFEFVAKDVEMISKAIQKLEELK